MFPVVIWGTDQISENVATVIEKLYNKLLRMNGGEDLQVVAFIGQANDRNNINGVPVISLDDFMPTYHEQGGVLFIVPREHVIYDTMLISKLLKRKIRMQDIYLTCRVNRAISSVEELQTFLSNYPSARFIPYLEYHVTDHCNLNCAACEHYSGLVKDEKYTDYDRLEKDFWKLRELVDDIGRIRIMGGEPLLHKDIEKFIILTRKVYPKAIISVVTNALLVKTMPDSLFQTMHDNGVGFDISFYPPLKEQIHSIVSYINERDVGVVITPFIEKFRVRQLLEPHTEDVFHDCLQAHCNNLYEGKIAACFLPFTTHYFNENFDKQIPEDGAIDLYDENLTSEKLISGLLTPLERCQYCASDCKEIDWRIIHKPSTMDDWIK